MLQFAPAEWYDVRHSYADPCALRVRRYDPQSHQLAESHHLTQLVVVRVQN